MSYGIDLGVTQTKVYVFGRCDKFDSLVARPPETEVQGGPMDRTAGLEITIEGDRRYVGAKAASDGESSNYPVRPQGLDDTDDFRWCAALSIIGPREPITVTTGLPVLEYNKHREAFEQHLTRVWKYTANGRGEIAPATRVRVILQGAGMYYRSILDDRGKVENSDRARRKVLAFDIGGRTVNVVSMQNAQLRAGSFTIFQGMVNVYNAVRKQLYTATGVSISLYEAGVATRQGFLELGNDKITTLAMARKAADAVWPEIRSAIELECPQWRTYNELLLGGGGGRFFEGYFREFFAGVPIEVSPEPEYDNVIGYGRYNLLMEGRP